MLQADQLIHRLKLRDLRVFQTVVEQGAISRAAESLSISRPVVSRTISNLERSVGMPLLDRHPDGVEPTPFGRALLKRSVKIFDELRQGLQEIEFIDNPTTGGELRIGCSEYMAAGLLPAVIDRLSRSYPQLTFKLELGDPAVLQSRDLRERKVEFVVARMLVPQPEPDMEMEVLFHERVFIAAGISSKWAARRKIELTELSGEPWMLAPLEISEGSPLVETFRINKLAVPTAKVLGYSLPLRNGLLATGRFLTVVPGSVLRFGAERFLLKPLPINLPQWRLPVAIITARNRTLGPLAQIFIECMREMAKPLGRS